MKRRVLATLLSVLMAGTVLAGCGSSSDGGSAAASSAPEAEETVGAESGDAAAGDPFADLPATIRDGDIVATPEMYPGVDMSKPYTVNVYLVGDTFPDQDAVIEKMNERLEPFNTTIKVTVMGWADVSTMYSLVLAGGEDIDLIFTAPWEYMWTEAAKGSFVELTEDFRNQYMPLTMKYQDPVSFGETTLSGKMYSVSCNMEKPQAKIVAIRQDIADKYGISELTNWDDFMNYMLTVAEKETPETGIYASSASGNNKEFWDVYRQQYDDVYCLDDNYLTYMFQYQPDTIPQASEIKFAWETDTFRNFAKDMKKLADAGCWSRGALSSTTTPYDGFANLQGAAFAWNLTVYNYMDLAEQNEGVKCAAYDLTKNNIVSCEEYNNADMAIASGSKDPARAAMVLDIFKYDTAMNRLITLGIEGTHYTLDGFKYTKLEKNGDYPADGTSLSWGCKTGLYEDASMPEDRKAMNDSWTERMVGSPTVTFVFDQTPVADQAAAVKTVLADYVPALQLGLVDDVDASIEEMMTKCKEAGLDEVNAEFEKQYNAWREANQ